jgi:SEC-C motif domain protein
MRSRYAAFALGLGEYLWNTLAGAHPDRGLARDAHIQALSQSRRDRRFLGLSILHAATEGETGEVLFYARIFSHGQDRSFVELSSFRREGSAWRYADGLLLPTERLPRDVLALDKAAFLALTEGRRVTSSNVDITSAS